MMLFVKIIFELFILLICVPLIIFNKSIAISMIEIQKNHRILYPVAVKNLTVQRFIIIIQAIGLFLFLNYILLFTG